MGLVRRPFMDKLDSGEFIYTWNGFTPHYAGCFYGSTSVLGGEEKFKHCYGFFSGIGDVEWWVKEELDKLSTEDQAELLAIIIRNKTFDDLKKKIAKDLAALLDVQPYQVYRVPNKELFAFIESVKAK